MKKIKGGTKTVASCKATAPEKSTIKIRALHDLSQPFTWRQAMRLATDVFKLRQELDVIKDDDAVALTLRISKRDQTVHWIVGRVIEGDNGHSRATTGSELRV